MKKLSVIDFASQIGVDSDRIPVIVKDGAETVGRFESLYKLPAQAAPGILEAKIRFVTLLREEIVIQIKQRDYNSRKP